MMIFKGRNRNLRLSAGSPPEPQRHRPCGDDDKTVHAVAGGTVGFCGRRVQKRGWPDVAVGLLCAH